ncbi:MAG: hypothetical protein OXG47_00010 [bacterium]|nr:hypothetical protein [bacterium]
MGVEVSQFDYADHRQGAALALGAGVRGTPHVARYRFSSSLQKVVYFLAQFSLRQEVAATDGQTDAEDDSDEGEQPDAGLQAHGSRAT